MQPVNYLKYADRMSFAFPTEEPGEISTEKKWEEIYQKHSPLLFGYLIKKMGYDLASDILQESFFRLLNAMKSGKNIENHKAYVFQIARNLICTERKRADYLKRVDLPAHVEDEKSDTEKNFITNEFLDLLETARKNLKPDELEIFEMRWGLGFKQKEIALAISRSERQVRRKIEKIVQKIRNIYNAAGWNQNEIEQ